MNYISRNNLFKIIIPAIQVCNICPPERYILTFPTLFIACFIILIEKSVATSLLNFGAIHTLIAPVPHAHSNNLSESLINSAIVTPIPVYTFPFYTFSDISYTDEFLSENISSVYLKLELEIETSSLQVQRSCKGRFAILKTQSRERQNLPTD